MKYFPTPTVCLWKAKRDNFRRSTKRTLSQLRPRTQSGRMAPAQWTHPQAPADAHWTHNGRTAPAGRTHPRAPVDAQWTQDTRVLDAVFDKLFLMYCRQYCRYNRLSQLLYPQGNQGNILSNLKQINCVETNCLRNFFHIGVHCDWTVEYFIDMHILH
jgi:hypothetical protein